MYVEDTSIGFKSKNSSNYSTTGFVISISYITTAFWYQEISFTLYLDYWLFSVRKRHQYWVQTKELIQLFINWASWYRFPRLQLHFGTRKFLSTSNKLNNWESIQHMAISSQSTPRLLISQVGIPASLEKTIPMGQLCMCAFQWYLEKTGNFSSH